MDAYAPRAARLRKTGRRALMCVLTLLFICSLVLVFPSFRRALPAYAATPLQINAGGPAVGSFVADTYYSGGTTASTSNAIDTSGVTNPAPQAVYQSNRYGNFTYTIPGLTAGATYLVRLHFAETYWTAAGKRVFNVSINGQQVLSNFDIYAAAGGANKAVVKEFSVTASGSGTLTIQFSTVVDNAQVNGLEVLPASGATPTATATSTPPTGTPNFGPNVYIFDPSMPSSTIQSTLDSIYSQQQT
ncbi:malectin domain-containing carbohydrate-binding protein, partial [Thermogemmatispora sp.]|uniref:malectin n=1 Tax=Thermogemmatispora sp. TaxID=1968838 RepID=UPI0035E3FCF9